MQIITCSAALNVKLTGLKMNTEIQEKNIDTELKMDI